jgi:hypothetical protein
MVLTEFLVKIAAEATLISMGIEGISRVTGIHFFRIISRKIPNSTARNLTERFLDWGEFCTNQSIKFYKFIKSKNISKIESIEELNKKK